jgi:hypothetical protein
MTSIFYYDEMGSERHSTETIVILRDKGPWEVPLRTYREAIELLNL